MRTVWVILELSGSLAQAWDGAQDNFTGLSEVKSKLPGTSAIQREAEKQQIQDTSQAIIQEWQVGKEEVDHPPGGKTDISNSQMYTFPALQGIPCTGLTSSFHIFLPNFHHLDRTSATLLFQTQTLQVGLSHKLNSFMDEGCVQAKWDRREPLWHILIQVWPSWRAFQVDQDAFNFYPCLRSLDRDFCQVAMAFAFPSFPSDVREGQALEGARLKLTMYICNGTTPPLSQKACQCGLRESDKRRVSLQGSRFSLGFRRGVCAPSLRSFSTGLKRLADAAASSSER
ncbi:hypothetical protein H920_04203 [Fukomys damarensis]|uniref:Uncharacterized protein n=1 Tax=Fukomys damarensis TaxID=885580 RepID=A0A091EG32_FUKDA|nr:hypothetical protein H920_04203 [Fukomys damarensis]